MSETAKGPGWWQASDGEWYPPDQRPAESSQRVQVRGEDSAQGPGWWLASDGKWYAPELRQSTTQERAEGAGAPSSQGPGWWQASDRLWYPSDLRQQPSVTERPGVPSTAEEPRVRVAAPRPDTRRARTSRRRYFPAGLLVVVVALGLVIGLLVSSGPSGPSSPGANAPSAALVPAGGWILAGVRVVGAPVVVQGRVIAIVVNALRATELEALDPSTGHVLWQVPYSLSDINAGIPLLPLYQSGTVLDLAPTGAATDPSVRVEGINLATGATTWTLGTSEMVVDAPQLCAGPGYFCIDGVTAAGSSALQLVNPASGETVSVVPGPARQLSHDLYQVDTSPQSVEMLDSSGRVGWMVAVSTAFRGPQFSPDNGFNIGQLGGNYVGTVGATLQGTTVPLREYQAVGLRTSDGSVAWTRAGSYECLGALHISAPFVCRYSSDGKLVGERLTVDRPTLTLEGINTANGSVTWSKTVRDAQALTDAQGLPQGGGSVVVVTLHSGNKVLLDLSDGATSPVPGSDTFWCATDQMVIPIAPAAALVDGARDATPTYTACSASGAPLTTLPDSVPSSVGVTVGGYFVWPAPEGLSGLRLAH